MPRFRDWPVCVLVYLYFSIASCKNLPSSFSNILLKTQKSVHFIEKSKCKTIINSHFFYLFSGSICHKMEQSNKQLNRSINECHITDYVSVFKSTRIKRTFYYWHRYTHKNTWTESEEVVDVLNWVEAGRVEDRGIIVVGIEPIGCADGWLGAVLTHVTAKPMSYNLLNSLKHRNEHHYLTVDQSKKKGKKFK